MTLLYYQDESVTLWHGDALEVLRGMPDASVDCCVTSPPYFRLRDYGVDGQLGAESSPAEYVENLRAVFAEVRRVLADDGTLWLNLGLSYASSSPSGPQGKTGQRAGRTFTAEGVGGAAHRGAPRDGTPGTEQPGSPATDCACSCHGGERADAPSRHNSGTTPQTRGSSAQGSLTGRGTERPGSVEASPAASALDAPASTIPLSPPPPQGECSHSETTASSPESPRSSSDGVPASEGTEWCNSCTFEHESESRSQDMDASGMAWLNYTAALPQKSLIPIPWMVAMALQMDGWILRNDIIWAKPNGMPESVVDRLSTKHEHVFLLTKSRRYWFDLDPIRDEPVSASETRPQLRRARQLARERGITDEHLAAMRAVGMSDAGKALTTQVGTGRNREDVQRLADEAKAALGGYYREFLTPAGRNPGDVWTIPTAPFPGAHFATMPSALAERCVMAGCKPGGVVLDPFSGSGTTGYAATKHGRRYVGIDLNPDYLDLSLRTRLAQGVLIDDGGAA